MLRKIIRRFYVPGLVSVFKANCACGMPYSQAVWIWEHYGDMGHDRELIC